VTPRFLEANGLRFAYLEAGAGPLVLLAHGFPDSAHTWDRALPALAAAGYRAVAPFSRGYAPTAIPAVEAYDAETLARDLLAIAEALGAERAVIVGHDWGAAAGYAAAALAPERVQLLVPVALPHPRGLRITPALWWRARHFAALRRRGAAARIRAAALAYVDELWRRWSPGWHGLPSSETAAAKAALREPGCLEAALGYYRAVGVRMPAAYRVPIAVPTVAFAGEADLIAPRAFERARHCFAASYEVIQVPGGHFLHRQHPEAFVRELLRALGDHAPARA
jgi:pimeloyl-ACP methyl ester carboxylesterase